MTRQDRRPKVGIYTRPVDLGGGSGSHLAQLIQHMAPARDRFDLRLIHHGPSEHPVYQLLPELLVPRNPWRAARRLREEKFDLLHFAPPTVFTPAWMRDVRRVATIHSMEALQIPEHYGLRRRWHDRYVLARYGRRMDAVFTVSETSREFLVSGLGVPRERIRLTYNAVSGAFRRLDEAEREAARERLRRDHGITTPFLFHVSLYRRRKNPWTLLEAFARLTKRASTPPDLRLVIAGQGWDQPAVEEILRRTGVGARVTRVGFVPHERLVDFLNLASAFVFPTLFEGSGMSNLEAMACGCPVITARSGAVPEIVGDAASVVDDPGDAKAFADQIQAVLEDPALREQLIQRGHRRVARFSWDESAKTVLNTYGELCGA